MLLGNSIAGESLPVSQKADEITATGNEGTPAKLRKNPRHSGARTLAAARGKRKNTSWPGARHCKHSPMRDWKKPERLPCVYNLGSICGSCFYHAANLPQPIHRLCLFYSATRESTRARAAPFLVTPGHSGIHHVPIRLNHAVPPRAGSKALERPRSLERCMSRELGENSLLQAAREETSPDPRPGHYQRQCVRSNNHK